MAIFRKVHTSIWGDSFFSELDKEKKLFYLYVLTNERTKQCGVYEITKKQISFDLGYTIDRVSILLKYFISTGKIRYNDKTFELAVGNWLKYNSSTSPKVQSCINKEFSNVKDTLLIEYVKSIDTASQEEQEEEQEQEEEYNDLFIDFWDNYHLTTKQSKTDRDPTLKYWNKLTEKEKQKAIDNITLYYDNIKDYGKGKMPKKARTYLSDKNFNDEYGVILKEDENLPDHLKGMVY